MAQWAPCSMQKVFSSIPATNNSASTKPDLIERVHRDYVEAGADLIETNTFGANRLKLEAHGIADQLEAINRAAVHPDA